jgi:hypothetical protein
MLLVVVVNGDLARQQHVLDCGLVTPLRLRRQ